MIDPLPSVNRLSTDLEAVLAEAQAGKAMDLGTIETQLKARGYAIALMLLAAPFTIPSIPGLSSPFGLAIMLMGVRILGGHRPQLPGFIRKRSVSPTTLAKLLRGMIKVARWLERWVRPRMRFLTRWPGMVNLSGLSITLSGLFLLLPLPIPFTNTLPALAVIMLAIGMMERDGVCVLLGHLFALASWGYLGLFYLLGAKGFQWFG